MIILGLTGAWMLAGLVESFLFQVEPSEPVVYAACVAVLAAVALLAAAVPARRASRVDPLIALRSE